MQGRKYGIKYENIRIFHTETHLFDRCIYTKIETIKQKSN